MEGTDATADIKFYVNYGDTSLDINFAYQGYYTFPKGRYSNPIRGMLLNYSTPCAPIPATASPDTTICYGETVQLHATGGTKYEWSSTTSNDPNNPAPGLSCSNCANPVFSGGSSQVYTVRIWNGDSCSVVRPVRIQVTPCPSNDIFTAESTLCGTALGKIESSSQPLSQFFAVSASGDTLPSSGTTLSNLGAGAYSVFYTDTNGCKSADTIVTITANNPTIAKFDTHPDKGNAPLQVNIENLSQNATDYSWSLNGIYQGNSFSGFLADTSGTYQIELIAWNNNSICADTAVLTVEVFDNVAVQIYNLVSPNKDGLNDTWVIKGITNYPNNTVHIFNRWGNEVFAARDYQNDWGGKAKQSGKLLPSGTYFYTVEIKDKGKVKKWKGYLEVER